MLFAVAVELRVPPFGSSYMTVNSSGYTPTTTMSVADNTTGTQVDDSLLLRTSNCSTNSSSYLCGNVTTQATTANSYRLLLPIGVIIVIVLAAACLVLGVIYAYVHFTRESAMTNKKPSNKSSSSRQQHGEGGTATDPDDDNSYTTHMFLFRKHHSVAGSAT